MRLNKLYVYIALILAGCVTKDKTFERKAELFNYFMSIHSIDLTNGGNSFVIIISGHCGSCTKETIDFIEKLGKDNRFSFYEKYVLVPQENNHLIPEITDILNENFVILEDSNLKMIRYGLLYSKNVFLEINDNEIQYWDWLYMDNIYNIRKHYFKE